MNNILLEIRNLMVFYENAIALNDFSMELYQGEVRGVIGSNSAGKTTLMHAISGLLIDIKTLEQRGGGERITITGEILFQGKAITELPPVDRVRMGVVLCRERHPIFPENTVTENLKIAGFTRKSNEIRPAIDWVFELFYPLKPYHSKPAGLLSGGEQQMLSIGMALMVKPGLLLLDEPLLGLSPMLQRHLIETIIKVRDLKRLSVLLTEQFARPLLRHLDYVYIIENGLYTLSGKGDELQNNPEVRAAYFGV
jgi:branched-chain amino acid transport system ATP-binding protein